MSDQERQLQLEYSNPAHPAAAPQKDKAAVLSCICSREAVRGEQKNEPYDVNEFGGNPGNPGESR
jgi:hypothetical protein